jgi:hypothetical protein
MYDVRHMMIGKEALGGFTIEKVQLAAARRKMRPIT